MKLIYTSTKSAGEKNLILSNQWDIMKNILLWISFPVSPSQTEEFTIIKTFLTAKSLLKY